MLTGKKYFNVTMNGITRTIYKEPADNAFYAPLYKKIPLVPQ